MKGSSSMTRALSLLQADTDQPSPATCSMPVAAKEITPGQADTLAALFKALDDPHRVRIVNLLANAEGPVCVCDFMPQLGLAQPTVSFHLTKLHRFGLIDPEKRGTWAY